MAAVTGTILVVDDQATNRMKMSLAVKAWGTWPRRFLTVGQRLPACAGASSISCRATFQ